MVRRRPDGSPGSPMDDSALALAAEGSFAGALGVRIGPAFRGPHARRRPASRVRIGGISSARLADRGFDRGRVGYRCRTRSSRSTHRMGPDRSGRCSVGRGPLGPLPGGRHGLDFVGVPRRRDRTRPHGSGRLSSLGDSKRAQDLGLVAASRPAPPSCLVPILHPHAQCLADSPRSSRIGPRSVGLLFA